jgi:hypothetical protein
MLVARIRVELYLFEASPEFLTFTPTDPSGVPIGNGINECALEDLQTVHVRAMHYGRRGEMPDRLSIGIKRYIVLRSEVAKLVIDQHRIPGDLRLIPVVVFSEYEEERLSGDFVLLHSNIEYDVLDRTQSRYVAVSSAEHGEVIVSVTKWIVRGADVPPLDIFPVMPNDWIITDAVKSTFDRCAVTGVKLTNVSIA